jgi:hypothetical protein
LAVSAALCGQVSVTCGFLEAAASRAGGRGRLTGNEQCQIERFAHAVFPSNFAELVTVTGGSRLTSHSNVVTVGDSLPLRRTWRRRRDDAVGGGAVRDLRRIERALDADLAAAEAIPPNRGARGRPRRTLR